MSGPRKRDDAFARVFGTNLARCRERLRVSQEELGFRAGLHRTAVGQLERGERIARTDTLVRLCSSLDVGADTLLAGLGWRPTRIAVGELEIQEIEPTESANQQKRKAQGNQNKKSPRTKQPAAQKASNEPAKEAEKEGKEKTSHHITKG